MGMLFHQNKGPYDYSIEFIKNENNLKVFKIKHDGFSAPVTDDLDKIFDDPSGSFKPCQCIHGGDIIFKDDGNVIVILSEIKENGTGTSVTNMFEDIATMVYNELLKNVVPENIIWVEYYPADGRIADEFSDYGRLYKKVCLNYEKPGRFLRNIEFTNPSWSNFSDTEIKSYFHVEAEPPSRLK